MLIYLILLSSAAITAGVVKSDTNIIAAASDVYIQEKMPPMLLLPSCNYAEVDYENATHAADTHINTLLLPTAISLLLYRYY